MKKDIRIIIWGAIYMFYVYMAYQVTVVEGQEDFTYFLYGNLFSIQKYFFDVSIFFMVYLFIFKKTFTSPMFVSRCKDFYLSYVLLYGIKKCSLYIIYTLILFLGWPIIFGLTLELNMSLIREVINLFSFLFTMYLLYLYLLLKTNNQMFSLLAGFVINFIMLVVYFVVSTINQDIAIIGGDLLRISYPVLSILMILLTIIQYRRKELFI